MFNNNTPFGIRRLYSNLYSGKNAKNNNHKYGQVLSVSTLTEEMVVYNVPTKVTIRHPFVSVNAWDRAMPEIGSTVLTTYSPDTNDSIMDGYFITKPSESVSSYSEGNSLYRELSSGELDRMSSGMAYTFHGNRPVKESYAGLVGYRLDGDYNTFYEEAPLFVRELHQNEVATIKDTYRLGVVRRPTSSVETRLFTVPLGDGVVGAFAKEHTLVLATKVGLLLDYREGNVIDDMGISTISSMSGNYLRVQKLFYTSLQNHSTFQIDTCGNVYYETAPDAVMGIKISIPNGRFVQNVGQDISITSTLNTLIQASGLSTATFGGFLTKLGLSAEHTMLYGDTFVQNLLEFLTKLAVHTHPGTTPSPDLSTACLTFANTLPSSVSRSVQTE